MTRRTDRRARLLAAIKMGEIRGFQAVKPATVKELLAHEAEKPMRAGNQDLPHTSRFGDAHLQISLF